MARQVLRFTQEVTPGTFQASAPAAQVTVLRLTGDDAFPGRPEPNIAYVTDAGGSNRRVAAAYGTMKCSGSFSTLSYFSQAKLLYPWMFNIISDGAGSFIPPYTFTMDHLIQTEASTPTFVYRRYLGCYAGDSQIRANNQGNGIFVSIGASFEYLAVSETVTVTDIPMPALTDYPSGNPIIFQQAAGLYTVGTARTNFRSAHVRCANVLDQIYDESKYPQAIKWCGRVVSFGSENRYKSDADRLAFEAVTAQSASLGFTDSVNLVSFDFKTQNVFSSVGDSLPLGKAHYQTVELQSLLTAASTDLVVTVTP